MNRRGITITELVCASLITAVVIGTVVPMLYSVRKQHNATNSHFEANEAVTNILNEISSRPYDQVTTESLAGIQPPEWVRKQLVDANLKLTAEPNAGGKRISARLSWQSTYGSARKNVQMHVWIFKGDPA